MAIMKAYTLPHPPLAVPSVWKGKESKEISDTLNAMDKVASDIASIAPETIIYITPHSTVYSDYFHISPGETAHGDLGRFGAPGEVFETNYDTELVREIMHVAEMKGIYAGSQGEKDAKLDHGVTVPMWFINKRYSDYKSIRISQSGMTPIEHYMFGQIIAEAAANVGRKTVLIASSDLSHKLTADGPYGFAPEGPEFDKMIISAIEESKLLTLFEVSDELRERAGECGYNSLTILTGCFDKINLETKLISYEGPFGVGYAVAEFTPTTSKESKGVLEVHLNNSLKNMESFRASEDEYQRLARGSLEHMVLIGEEITAPSDLSDELINIKAGVFVSIHKDGRLRGCVGTISPSTESVASEIIQNAVSAGLSDNRFEPVNESELPYLTYKVDVLAKPEPISEPSQLDIERYGVIVTSGFKRGLLLPNLDGIDTVDDQIMIAKNKAGISSEEKVKLERFEVIRHG